MRFFAPTPCRNAAAESGQASHAHGRAARRAIFLIDFERNIATIQEKSALSTRSDQSTTISETLEAAPAEKAATSQTVNRASVARRAAISHDGERVVRERFPLRPKI
jgi:DNA primase